MKSCHTVIWWGSIPIVKGSLIHPMGCTELPLNVTRGAWKRWSLSQPILILSNAEINRMSIKLPLSIKIIWMFKLAIMTNITNASSWGRYKPLRSSLVKVMGWWAPTIGGEVVNLFFSSLTSFSSVPFSGWTWTFPWRKSFVDRLNATYCQPVINISPFMRIWTWAINSILSQIPSLDQLGYLLFQLEGVLGVMSMIPMKLTKFILIPPEGVSLDFP